MSAIADKGGKPWASALVLPSMLVETSLPPRREEDSVVDEADAIAVVVDAIKTTKESEFGKRKDHTRFHHCGCSCSMSIIERSLNILCFVEQFEFMGSIHQ